MTHRASKKFILHARLAGQPMFWGTIGLNFCLLVVLSSTGCRKAGSPASNVSGAESNAVVAAQDHEPVYSPTPAAAAPTVTPNGEPDLGELNRSLLRWVMANRRKPASFEDFAATANVTIPPPPAGKKYAINPSTMHIVLVNQ
jgi:hypothetical protein